MGRKSGEIESLLGFRGREELIHRDDLVILQERVATQSSVSAQQLEEES
jgi:glutamate 5-kinase